MDAPYTARLQVRETFMFAHSCLSDLNDAARLIAEFKLVGSSALC